MAGIGRQPLDRRDPVTLHVADLRLAGEGARAIDMDHASAAQTRAAPEFGAGEFEPFAENPKERGVRWCVRGLGESVDRELNHRSSLLRVFPLDIKTQMLRRNRFLRFVFELEWHITVGAHVAPTCHFYTLLSGNSVSSQMTTSATLKFPHLPESFHLQGQKNILKNKATIRLNIRDPFAWQEYRGLTEYGNIYAKIHSKFDVRQLTASFTYRFGKNIQQPPARRRNNATQDEQNRVGSGN